MQTPKTFNYYILKNVIKVVTNFVIATSIQGTSVTNGGACLGTCYLTYSSMVSPITLTTPSNSYSIHLEGVLTTVVINPLFTL